MNSKTIPGEKGRKERKAFYLSWMFAVFPKKYYDNNKLYNVQEIT